MSTPGIGALRRRITLESQSRSADGGGGVVITWTPVAEVWAEMHSPSGSEGVTAEGLQGRVTHVLTIRRRSDVKPAMRARLGQRLFMIEAVLDGDGAEPFLRLLAEERNL